MKRIQSKLRVLALAAGSLAITMAAASAQNANFAPGDLVLYFQNPSGSTGAAQTFMVNLGQSATLFRANSQLATPANQLNIKNIGTELTSAFGSSWWEATTLRMGLAASWSAGETTDLLNADPERTIYVSRARTAVGTPGSASSSNLGTLSNTNMTGVANNIISQNNRLETQSSTDRLTESVTTSFIDNQNPVAGSAFGAISGGTQKAFAVGSFGSFGAAGAVENVLDLYRVQADNTIDGQFGFGSPIRAGAFMGSVTINQSGDVSFVAVPEPSTYALLAFAALVVAFAIRRRRNSLQTQH